MSVSEAERELGLTEYHIFLAVERDEIEVFRPGGGNSYKKYSEKQLRALAERLGAKCSYLSVEAA